MTWETVPICAACWNDLNPGMPVDKPRHLDGLGPGIEEDCQRCGRETRSGIYIRAKVAQ